MDSGTNGSVLDLKAVREEVGMSQREFAALVGVSPRAIQSCEQGWRKPSALLEKQALLLLIAHRGRSGLAGLRCWEYNNCSDEYRPGCLAYRAQLGYLCWYLTGNVCLGRRHRNWEEKHACCMDCAFFKSLIGGSLPRRPAGPQPPADHPPTPSQPGYLAKEG